MSIPASKTRQLQALFSRLSEQHRQMLVMTVMAAKADGEIKLPYDELLILLGVDSEQDARWEDIFTVAQPLYAEKSMRCDQIERDLLEIVWDFYLRDLDAVKASAWLSGDLELSEIRAAMIASYTEVMGSKKGERKLVKRFGENKQCQLNILMSLLSRSEELEDFFAGWPQSIKSLGEEHLDPLREFNEHLIAQSPEITPHLLFLVAAHLEHPFQVFRAVEKVTGHSNDRVMIKTELKIVGDALLDQNDIWLDAFNWERNKKCDPEAYVQALKGFVDLTSGWLSEFDVDPDGAWGKRLSSQRSRCGKSWDEHMGRVKKCIEQVLPRKRGSVTGRQTMPDIKKDVIEQEIAMAENAVSLLVAAQPFAAQGGFQSSKDKVAQLLESRLQEQSDDLLAMLAQEHNDYNQISAHFAVLVRITRAYSGDQDANVLARRSVAAMAA